MSIFTAPTTITLPFFRVISAESSTGSFVGAAAVIITLSKPCPFVNSIIEEIRLLFVRCIALSAANSLANFTSLSDKSIPKTLQPFAFKSCEVI